MKIAKINSIACCYEKGCGGFQKPKGHLDSQMFPECEGTKFDRNIVKKTVERRKRHRKHKKTAGVSLLHDMFNIKDPNLSKTKALASIIKKLEDALMELQQNLSNVSSGQGNAFYINHAVIRGAEAKIREAMAILKNHMETIEQVQRET